MKRTLIMQAALLLSTAALADTPLTVEQGGTVRQSYDLLVIRCIDLANATDIRIVGADGTVLQSGLTATTLKLNFTDDVPTAVETVSAADTTENRAQKLVIDGKLVIKTADGITVNAVGQRIK
ncbi:MAG: hypothetical protein E7070_10030 [Bacteroidales bacterium]|jgi:hypothetical protein|nr:hypothetical protein [Bacteroidales bacterium]